MPATIDLSGAAIPQQERLTDINFSGVFYGMPFAIPEIEWAGGGAVVNVASILGSVGFANSTTYVSAKHGVLGATKNAALEQAASAHLCSIRTMNRILAGQGEGAERRRLRRHPVCQKPELLTEAPNQVWYWG